jgi:hypothetical protein
MFQYGFTIQYKKPAVHYEQQALIVYRIIYYPYAFGASAAAASLAAFSLAYIAASSSVIL